MDVPIPSMLLSDDFGENTQDYALPSKEIPPFLSSYANAIGPSDRYGQVDGTEITELVKRSHARVEGSQEFRDLEKKIAQTRAEKGVLRLSELMQEREEAKKNGDGKQSDLDWIRPASRHRTRSSRAGAGSAGRARRPGRALAPRYLTRWRCAS